jgi:hypothetical protein
VGKFVPKLSQKKQMLYTITRLTLDNQAKDREIKVRWSGRIE